MIFDNSETDLFYNFYTDDPLGFLVDIRINTELAREKANDLIRTCKKIIKTIDKIEKENK